MTYRAIYFGAACFACLVASLASAKTSGTYFTEQDLAAIRERAKQPAYARDVAAIVKKAKLIADRSDDEIWQMIPDADVPRALNVRFGVGCPEHGPEVFKKRGHYPWIMSPDKPFKLKCPVGGEEYPSNDYAAYLRGGRKDKLDTRQKYVDDGFGWIDAEGNRYWFAAHYMFWEHWRRTIIDGVTACGKAYAVTGDPTYAHKAAVALARISQVYPKMDYAKQAYHSGKWPAAINGRILDYIWENSTCEFFATTYDLIYDAMGDDGALKSFAAEKGIADVKAAIERDVLQVQVGDILQKKIWGNKFELGSLSTLALVLDNDDPAKGTTTRQMVEWLLTGDGELEFTFYNGFDRDGMGGESSPGYSSIWNDRCVAAADNLVRLGVDIGKHPKWLRIAKAPAELRILNKLAPHLGDHGGTINGSPRIMKPDLFRFAVERFADGDSANWLLASAEKPELFKRGALDPARIKQLAGKSSFPDAPYTRDLGGYGLAILELNDGAETRSATMYYGGPAAGHGHNDRLTISYHLRERDVFGDLGYPSHWGPIADHWVRNTPSHYAVMVNEKPQSNRLAGHVTRFADLHGLKLVEADATVAWTGRAKPASSPAGSIQGKAEAPRAWPSVKQYARTLALLDTGEKSTLLIDAYVVEGGDTHDYSFHGLPYGTFSVEGAKLIKQQDKGTLAGEGVGYNEDPGGGRIIGGYQFFMKPRWYEPADVAHLRWTDDDGLNQDTWFPRFAFDEVVVADTIPPIKPGYPESMPYTLLRKKGKDLTSLFLGITDINAGPTKVKRVTRIGSKSPKAGGAVVEMNSGGAWRIYANSSGGRVRFDDGAETDVAFAAIQVQDGRPRRAKLVGGGSFTANDVQTVSQPPGAPMTVTAVDYAKNIVRVDGPAPALGEFGTVVRAVTGRNAQSYTIRSADNGTLGFGQIGLLTGRFACAWDPAKKRLVAKERTGGVYNQFNGKPFPGMTAVSEDYSATAVITAHDARANTFTIDADDATAARFNDANGDGRAYVYIADIGPGTQLIATPATSVEFAAQRAEP